MIQDQEKLVAPVSVNHPGSSSSSTNQGLSIAMQRLKRELGRDIDALTGEIDELKEEVTVYQQRVENTPRREQELMSLRRDYQNIQESYNSLLARRLEAEISVNMERKQKGERFRVIDPARMPQRPIEPDMRKLFMLYVAAGLGLGGGIVFVIEFLNNSFKDPDDIEEALDLPVLGTMPPIWDGRALKKKRLNTAFSALCLLLTGGLLGCFAVITIRGVGPLLKLIGPWL
jgi:capsular polysaccharide biosynthesis protein